jgi:sec-independent protein translocase protein TatC
LATDRMSYLHHLEEFRRRLIVIIVALVVAVGVCFYFAWDILHMFERPAGNIVLNYMTPMEPFLVRFKLALYGGVLLALPVVLFEVMAFLSPALKKNEKRYTVVIMVMLVFFFGLGVVVGYFVILPVGIRWLLNFSGGQMNPVISASQYVTFTGWFMLGIGISFETPMFIWMLVALRVLTPQQLRKNWRWAYIIILVFAAIITPDWSPVTMFLVAIPMIILYEISILLAKFTVKKRAAAAEAVADL